MTVHDLVQLARSLQLETLEQAWAEAAKAPKAEDGPRYRATVEALCNKDMAGRALSLCTKMVESLAGQNLLDEAIDLAQAVLNHGAHNEALVRQLVGLLERRFSGQAWYSVLSERAGLTSESTDSQTVLAFDRLRRLTPRNAVYHPGGWGEGVVEEFCAERTEVTVTFASGRRSEFPLETIIDRFKPLEADDLRSMRLLELDKLREMAKTEPSTLIRKAAKVYRGTINSTQLKQELCPSVIRGKEWASFWKRAKSAATTDPWLKVEGSPTRPAFVLRDKPVGVAEEAGQFLRMAANLGERIGVLRDYLMRSQDEEVRRQVLDLAESVVAEAVEKQASSHAHMLDGILLLEEQGRTPPASQCDELRALIHAEDGTLRVQAIEQLATQQSRDHAVRLLPETLGAQWAEAVLANMVDFPDSVLENTVQLLVDQGHGPRILDTWEKVAPFPRRYPVLTYLFGRLYADGVFDQRPDKPDAVTVGRVLLHLARVLTGEKRGNPAMARLLGRVASLLAGKRGLLNRAMEEIDRDDLANYLGITERGGEDFPQEIIDNVLRVVARRHPELTAKPEKPFWEKEDVTYTTREGLRRIKEDYRVLVEDKIPANSASIGAAASLGDLSENSEWESAMEEQRNLTTRATMMDKELKTARLIEDQEVPEGVATPGDTVEFVEETSGTTRWVTILGPWDDLSDTTINYRAPLAQALLGRRIGDETEIPGEDGTESVRIVGIKRIV